MHTTIKQSTLTALVLLFTAVINPVRGDDAEQLPALKAKATTEAANKQLVRRWLSELWDQGNYELAA
jgi:hypothetical protein